MAPKSQKRPREASGPEQPPETTPQDPPGEESATVMIYRAGSQQNVEVVLEANTTMDSTEGAEEEEEGAAHQQHSVHLEASVATSHRDEEESLSATNNTTQSGDDGSGWFELRGVAVAASAAARGDPLPVVVERPTKVLEAAPAPITPRVDEPVLRFITALLYYAVQYGNKLGKPPGNIDAWKENCTAQLIKCFNDGKTTLKRRTLIPAVMEDLGIEAEYATNAIIRIYDMATKAKAGKADFNHVLGGLSQVKDEEKWRTIARRMLYVFGLWCNDEVVIVKDALNISIVRFVEEKEDLVTKFVKTLGLDEESMCRIAKKADHFPKRHEFQRRTYYDLSFATTDGSVSDTLIARTPQQRDKPVGTLPRRLRALLSTTPPDVIAISGESGGGKTLSALLAACYNGGVAFYAQGASLDFGSLEEQLKGCCRTQHAALAAAHLLQRLRGFWKIREQTESNVGLVIDEVGPFPRCARALCKMQSSESKVGNSVPKVDNSRKSKPKVDNSVPNQMEQTAESIEHLLDRIKRHFCTKGRVTLFVVGTGVEGALSNMPGDSMPASQEHLRVEEFGDLRDLYLGCPLWDKIKKHLPTMKELVKDEAVEEADKEPSTTTSADPKERGIFAKLKRLSQNPRMGALLDSLDTEAIDMASIAESKGAKASYLRGYALRIVTEALVRIKEYNGLKEVDQMRATTWFGVAFAVACSNEEQEEDSGKKDGEENPYITTLRTTYGLMRDCKTGESVEGLLHRYEMTAAATELGLSGFGMTPPKEGWSGFEHMMLDYLFLHAHGAACVKQTGMRLSSVASKYAVEGAEDPLAPIKDWIRKHAYTTTAKNVARTELKNQLTTCDAAAEALEKFASDTVETKKPCFVLALNGDKAPFADIIVGVLVMENDKHVTKHLMLLQLKRYEKCKLSVFEQCAAMRKMGCNSRGAVIAGCVAQLTRQKESWDDAMKPLTGVALRHRTTFDAYIDDRIAKKNEKERERKPNDPAPKDTNLMFLPLGERKAVFDSIIGDLSVSVKDASPQVHARTSPEVERFVVTYYPSLGSAPEGAGSVVNSLTITAANSAAAFYPTEWQNEAFSAPMAISEVMQLTLPPKKKKCRCR